MNPLTIMSYSDLTNSFVLYNIEDGLYEMTKACEMYGDKESFCEKIKDKCTRYMLLKPLVILTGNNIYNKIL
jgi:hypothetical protein